MSVAKADYAYGHKAKPFTEPPNVRTYCGDCLRPLTFIKQTNQPDQWRHPKRKR
jgi:hypothetical protein